MLEFFGMCSTFAILGTIFRWECTHFAFLYLKKIQFPDKNCDNSEIARQNFRIGLIAISSDPSLCLFDRVQVDTEN